MPDKHPAERTAAIREGVRQVGCRALVSAWTAGLGAGLEDACIRVPARGEGPPVVDHGPSRVAISLGARPTSDRKSRTKWD